MGTYDDPARQGDIWRLGRQLDYLIKLLGGDVDESHERNSDPEPRVYGYPPNAPVVTLSKYRWDSVLMVLEDHIEQVSPPYDDDLVSEDVQEEMRETADDLGETYRLILEQVSEGRIVEEG